MPEVEPVGATLFGDDGRGVNEGLYDYPGHQGTGMCVCGASKLAKGVGRAYLDHESLSLVSSIWSGMGPTLSHKL